MSGALEARIGGAASERAVSAVIETGGNGFALHADAFGRRIGAVLSLSPQWQLSSNWAYTERAPMSYELYANGVHAATSAYERGDPQQALERAAATST